MILGYNTIYHLLIKEDKLLFFSFIIGCSDPIEKTNPNQDSDGDGFTDIAEEEAGTNPNSEYSFPLELGDYNIGLCEGGIENATEPSVQAQFQEASIEWSHYAPGDVVQNMVLKDQYDQDVSLYQFCGQHIMLITASFT